ncbi:MAG: hypothetical protein J6J39_03915 [Clostridia bacterium]|nr:hypothetical protein [Clostridia bacterium]
MARKKNIKKFVEEIAKDNTLVQSRPIILSKKDMRKMKKSKKKKRIETGFIMDDFEILI